MNGFIGVPFQPIGKPPGPMFIILVATCWDGSWTGGADSSSTAASALADFAGASVLAASGA